ncbi:Bacteriophage Lambda NinG protein [compost metagenome]
MAKAKTCKACKTKFMPERPLQSVCTPRCGLELAARRREKERRERSKVEFQELRARKDRLKTRRDHLREAQQAFNEFIRWRDRIAGYPCISSGRPLDWSGNAVDAGHFRSVGAAPHLRFDERNCHAQSKHDNQFKSGNVSEYRNGLIARIGLEAVEALETDNSERRYTVDELKAIKEKYRAMARELKKKLA